MINRLKISLVIAPLALLLVIIAYIYSLWVTERQKINEQPVEAVGTMMRDLLRYHQMRGRFPESLKKLEGVVWDMKQSREYSANDRAISHLHYYYIYTPISMKHFTLWAIPTGKHRDESSSWFLAVTPELCRRWKGPAIVLEQTNLVNGNPTINDLGVLGLTEQNLVQLK